MKGRKALSALLFGLGCAATFIGFLALILPGVQNPQLQLVLTTFSSADAQGVARWMGLGAAYVLENPWYVILFGSLCMLIGGILFSHFDAPQPVRPERSRSGHADSRGKAVAANNPFAVPTQCEPPVFSRPEPPVAPVFQPRFTPLLEENRVEEDTLNSSLAKEGPLGDQEPIVERESLLELKTEPLPPTPPSFSSEAQAVEADTTSASPSGSRMILRKPQAPLPCAEPPAAPSVPSKVPSAPATASSRIRSTMGRHQMR